MEPVTQVLSEHDRRITMTPAPETLGPVMDFVAQALEDWGVGMKRANQIELACDELYSNIINYSGAAVAAVALSKQDTGIAVTFEDNGIAYDPTAKEDPDVTAAPEDREIGGLGIFLVKNFASFLGYRREEEKNILTVTFDNL